MQLSLESKFKCMTKNVSGAAGGLKLRNGISIFWIQKVALGRWLGLRRPSLSLVSRLEMIAPKFISEPVADTVEIVSNGRLFTTGYLPNTTSQMGASISTPEAIALALSMAEPPPATRITSHCSWRQRSMPS